jgi:hypothetical protein
MSSSTPPQPRLDAAEEAVMGDPPGEARGRVPMSRLLAAGAAAAAVCTPPAKPEPTGRVSTGQGSTSTRVPVGAKSQSV